jgi:endo-1,4-beta-xylanase
MHHKFQNRIGCFLPMFILTCLSLEISAGTSSGAYDYSHRKRSCEVKIVSPGGSPLPGLMVGISQIRNDFTFGGTIRRDALDSLGDSYGESFRNYFDAATPESEMKWESVMKCPQKCNSDFTKADMLVNWLIRSDILLRGHDLFSNEKEAGLPEWTRTLAAAAFKQAMRERIDTAMGHFKGKVAQWDIIDEICHGANGSLLSSGILQTKSGDTGIFKWILDEARKIDTVAEFVINDYGLITSGDQTAADQYITKVKPLGSLFNIVGADGHFGATMTKSAYEPKINYLAQQLGKKVLLTNVDFSFDTAQAPDKIEELMRTCFADTNVDGIVMGSWNQRYMSGGNITSYFVDSLGNETPAGQRWRDVRDEWKTKDIVVWADDSGKVSFTGFQGQYHVLISCDFDTFDLEPGEDTQSVVVVYTQEGSSVKRAVAGLKTIGLFIDGISVPVNLPARYNGQLFLTTYSLSGQQLSRSPVNLTGRRNLVTPASSSCRVFRIETADRLPLYAGKVSAVRH